MIFYACLLNLFRGWGIKKDETMHRILLAIAFATALAGSADAATKRKHHHVRVERPVAMEQRYQRFPNRPPWAAPQQCFTDEGYGRFTTCDNGGKGM